MSCRVFLKVVYPCFIHKKLRQECGCVVSAHCLNPPHLTEPLCCKNTQSAKIEILTPLSIECVTGKRIGFGMLVFEVKYITAYNNAHYFLCCFLGSK